MGCAQSSAVPASGKAGATKEEQKESAYYRSPSTDAARNGGRGGDHASPAVRVQAAASFRPPNAAIPTALESGATLTDLSKNCHDSVGTDCTPPPGGREGGGMNVGAPPEHLFELPGEPCGEGRVKRPPIPLAGGSTYEGTWKDTTVDGDGVLTAPDGAVYRGQFVAGKIQGQGRWTSTNGCSYEGQWSRGRADGEGKLTHEDGSVYEGQFKMDVKEGKAVETWADGTVYEGPFKDGEKSGFGKLRFPDGSTYEGEFKGDTMNGEGKYTWENQRCYQGRWSNGLMNGSGVYMWPSGQYSKFEGNFKDGLKEGKGRLYVRDGRNYSGLFHLNRLDGEVVEVMPSGRRRRGEWKNGTFVRWLEGAGKVELNVVERDTDHDEYTTSIFSNPEAYTQMYKSKNKKRLKVKGGVLRGKAKADETSDQEQA